MNINQKESTYRFRITLKAFSSEPLNIACNTLNKELLGTNCRLIGPIKLPTKTKRFCVLRSPHVDKDSREHFEIKFLKRIIDIHTSSGNVIHKLMQIPLPAGVGISIIRD